MQIVVNIPEKVVRAIQNGQDYRYDIHTAIAQGVPLPKGHGDLISRNAVRKKCIEAQDWGDTNTYINRGLAIAVDFIDCAPAVIPADKEKE